MKKTALLFTIIYALFLMSSCGKDGTGVFLFSLQNDKDLGAMVDQEIKSSGEFVILDRATNAQAYNYLNTMRDHILEGGNVKFKDEFVWELNIIDDDNTLNAFCTPGGYIYVYTGLINFLENSSSLAGVLGHEMAHADRRHSSKQIQEQYGVSILIGLLTSITGENGALLGDVASSLVGLAFSRADETEADDHSVQYLCPTEYESAGAASFFEKIGTSSTPAFLSTHPAPENRVQNIHDNAESLECAEDLLNPEINGLSYDEFKALL